MDTEISEYSLNWDGHIQHIRKAFNRLLHSNELCDVTLYVEGHKIGAHKVFLSACSKYFDQLFKDFKDERPVIVLKGMHFDILKHILNFVYNGETRVEVHQLKQFLDAAAFLKIDGLTENRIKRKRNNSLVNESENTSIGYDQSDITITQGEVFEKTELSPSKLSTEFPLLYTKVSKHPKLYKLSSKNQEVSNINHPIFSKAPVIGKYSIDAPTQIGEWLSDYEFHSQSSIAENQSPLEENTDKPSAEAHTNYNREKNIEKSRSPEITVIKSEPASTEITSNVEEMSSFSQFDFANSLDVEIDIFDSEENDELEKELLKTPLACINEKGFHQCNICEKSYEKKDSLKKHFAVHVNNTTCSICGKMLSRRTHLLRHYMTVHGKRSK